MEILFEDNHCIAVFKPAGIPVQATKPDGDSLQAEVQSYIKQRDSKPGNVFLGVVHRIDVGTQGIVVFGKTSKGAARLSESFRGRDVEKRYYAVVHGKPKAEPTMLWHRLEEMGEGKPVRVAAKTSLTGKEASLTFKTVKNRGKHTPVSLVEVELHTGRKHQIRAQLSAAGFPIVGDVLYGGGRIGMKGFGLLAYHLVFPHPIRREESVTIKLENADDRLSAFLAVS